MKQVIHTDRVPKAVGPYSQAILSGDFVFASGQLGIDPAVGKITGETAAQQAEQALRNVQAVLEAAGAKMSDVVKTTVLLTDIGDFAEVNAVYAGFFPQDPPARSCFAVAALPLGGKVEIEVICRK